MPLSINTNTASMNAQRAFLNTTNALQTAYERLSTGKRVNSAVDDAAGLSIGKDLESHVRGLNQAIRNTNDGISMTQITEGALSEVTSILQRMRDLSVQAANGSLSATERGYLDTEQSKLATTLGTVIDQAKFNNKDLISDSLTTSVSLQSGANANETTAISFTALTEELLKVDATMIDLAGTSSQAEKVTFGNAASYTAGSGSGVYTVVVGGISYSTESISTASTSSTTMANALNLAKDNQGNAVSTVGSFANDSNTLTFTHSRNGNVVNTNSLSSTHSGFSLNGESVAVSQIGASQASDAISVIDDALAYVASERATLGATQAQLESTVRNLANVAENTSAAAGRIMDTDYAAETANLTKAQILQQAATSVLAQANAQPQSVLALLR